MNRTVKGSVCPICGKSRARCWYGVPPLGALGLVLAIIWVVVLWL